MPPNLVICGRLVDGVNGCLDLDAGEDLERLANHDEPHWERHYTLASLTACSLG